MTARTFIRIHERSSVTIKGITRATSMPSMDYNAETQDEYTTRLHGNRSCVYFDEESGMFCRKTPEDHARIRHTFIPYGAIPDDAIGIVGDQILK